MIRWFNENSFASHMLVAIVCGCVSGILFASGFGAIALSVFISILVCTILMLGKMYMDLRNDLINLSELTRQTFASLSSDFANEIMAQQEVHHDDIQGVYVALTNLLEEGK